jgi:long-chain fatty acid transport protein
MPARLLRVVGTFGLSALLLAGTPARAQVGAVLSGAGPVDRSVAGAATALPLSAGGAIFWNPATLNGLGRSELEAGAELLFVHSRLQSGLGPNAFGPGAPPGPFGGLGTDNQGGPYALPTIALAYLPPDSPVAFGLGVFSLAGFGINYPGSPVNPVLTPPPPAGLGFGPIFSEYSVLQITPAVSYQVTSNLSVAVGASVDMARLQLEPGVFAAPDDANGNGFATYPPGTQARSAWGAGFTLGAYYREATWAAGASLRSPQWFESLRFNSRDEVGVPRDLKTRLDQPLIASAGAAYTGIDRWAFDVDVRYFDYKDARGFGDRGFNPDGSLSGLGWRSIFQVAVGAQFRPTDCTSVRVGYSWNQNPIPDGQTFVNVASPTITRHMAFAGASWDVTPDLSLSVAYMHAFDSAVQGTVATPAGPVPGSSVRTTLSLDSLLFGATVRFGPCACTCPANGPATDAHLRPEAGPVTASLR